MFCPQLAHLSQYSERLFQSIQTETLLGADFHAGHFAAQLFDLDTRTHEVVFDTLGVGIRHVNLGDGDHQGDA